MKLSFLKKKPNFIILAQVSFEWNFFCFRNIGRPCKNQNGLCSVVYEDHWVSVFCGIKSQLRFRSKFWSRVFIEKAFIGNDHQEYMTRQKDRHQKTRSWSMVSVLCSCGNDDSPSISKFLTNFLWEGEWLRATHQLDIKSKTKMTIYWQMAFINQMQLYQWKNREVNLIFISFLLKDRWTKRTQMLTMLAFGVKHEDFQQVFLNLRCLLSKDGNKKSSKFLR